MTDEKGETWSAFEMSKVTTSTKKLNYRREAARCSMLFELLCVKSIVVCIWRIIKMACVKRDAVSLQRTSCHLCGHSDVL